MENILEQVIKSVDLWIMAIVLCSGFFQKRYFKGFKISKTDEGYDSALKTLALSLVISVIYICLLKDPDKASNWSKYFFSYFGATSLYELLIDPFIKWIKKVTGGTDTK